VAFPYQFQTLKTCYQNQSHMNQVIRTNRSGEPKFKSRLEQFSTRLYLSHCQIPDYQSPSPDNRTINTKKKIIHQNSTHELKLGSQSQITIKNLKNITYI
jgi:hypothetical protein